MPLPTLWSSGSTAWMCGSTTPVSKIPPLRECWEDLPARIAALERASQQRRASVPGQCLKSAVETLQKEMVKGAVTREGSPRKAAAARDMDATTLCRLAKKLGVEP